MPALLTYETKTDLSNVRQVAFINFARAARAYLVVLTKISGCGRELREAKRFHVQSETWMLIIWSLGRRCRTEGGGVGWGRAGVGPREAVSSSEGRRRRWRRGAAAAEGRGGGGCRKGRGVERRKEAKKIKEFALIYNDILWIISINFSGKGLFYSAKEKKTLSHGF